MIYKVLADITVVLHMAWIFFLILGALWGRRSRLIKIVHLSGLGYSVALQTFGWYCPLTHLEFWLRSMHSANASYTGSFIVHYIEELVYLEAPQEIIFILTFVVIGLNIWLYLSKNF